MSTKEKPLSAPPITGVSQKDKTLQSDDNQTDDNFQCPRCKLSGNSDLFEPGWPDELHGLIAKHPELGINDSLPVDHQDARYLLNRLRRMK